MTTTDARTPSLFEATKLDAVWIALVVAGCALGLSAVDWSSLRDGDFQPAAPTRHRIGQLVLGVGWLAMAATQLWQWRRAEQHDVAYVRSSLRWMRPVMWLAIPAALLKIGVAAAALANS